MSDEARTAASRDTWGGTPVMAVGSLALGDPLRGGSVAPAGSCRRARVERQRTRFCRADASRSFQSACAQRSQPGIRDVDTSRHREHPRSASVGPNAIHGREGILWATNNMTVYLTVHEVAAMARCEHKSVRRAIAAGRLRAFQPNNKLLIREDDACGWIEGRPAARAASPSDRWRSATRRRAAPQSQR